MLTRGRGGVVVRENNKLESPWSRWDIMHVAGKDKLGPSGVRCPCLPSS